MTASQGDRDRSVAELLEEFLARPDARGAAAREAFVARHPDLADALRACLAGLDVIDGASSAIDASPLDTDRMLGDFRLIREAGRGAMGVVYEAEQVSLGRRVALKVLPFAAVLDERQLRRFRHEAQAAALLHHTNIVPVYAVGSERGVHYYAMQFVEGRTLAEVLAELRDLRERRRRPRRRGGPRGRARDRGRAALRGPAEDPSATTASSSAEMLAVASAGTSESPEYCAAIARLGVQAAEALDHAHENGVVHRDVKPANLMLDARGHLWVTDFGLARSRATPNMTATGAVLGTLRYMSPEQAIPRRAPLDHRTDVYSLGITLLEALALDPVFRGDDPVSVIHEIATREPEPLRRLNPAVPAALETILLKAAAKDPAARYASARELADDLRRFLANEPVRARRPPVTHRVVLWARRHRTAVVAGATAVLVARAVTAAAFVRVADAGVREAQASERSREDAAAAGAHFEKALDAIEQMLSRVGRDGGTLAGIPGLEPVRRDLLVDAARLYEDLLAKNPGHAGVRHRILHATVRLVEIRSLLGEFELAEMALTRADRLVAASAGAAAPWTAADLAGLERERGRLHAARERHAAALAAFDGSERICADAPDDPGIATLLAAVKLDAAHSLSRLGRFPEARLALGEGIARLESLGEGVEPAEVALDLSYALACRGRLDASCRRLRDAEAGLRRAIDVLPPEVAIVRRPAWEWLRAAAQRDLGWVLLDAGREADAEPLLRAALTVFERRAVEAPDVPWYGIAAATCRGTLAGALAGLGKREEAARAWDEASSRLDEARERFGGNREVALEIVDACQKLAARARSGEDSGAEERFERGEVQAWADLVAAEPESSGFAEGLAVARADAASAAGVEPAERARLLEAAITAFERSASRSVRNRRIAVLVGQLAHAYGAAGRTSEADAAYGRSIEVFKACASDDPADTENLLGLGSRMSDWGRALRDAGRLDEAQRRLAEARTVLAPLADADPEAVRQIAQNLLWTGGLEEGRGRFADAEAAYLQGIEALRGAAARRPTGRRVHVLLHANLGEALEKRGARGEAERAFGTAFEQGLALERDGFASPDVVRNTAASGVNLSHYLLATDRCDEATSVLRECVRLQTHLLQDDGSPARRLACAKAGALLLRAYHVAGRIDEVERTAPELAANCRAWRESDPRVMREFEAEAAWRLGSILFDDRRPAQAQPWLERALEVGLDRMRDAPIDHERRIVGECHVKLGLVAWELGRTGEAEPSIRRGLAVFDERADVTKEVVFRNQALYMRMLYADFLADAGRADDAVREARKNVEAARRWEGDPAPAGTDRIATSLFDLAAVLARVGRHAEVRAVHDAILARDKGTLPLHLEIAYALCDGEPAPLRDPPRAVALARKAVGASRDPKDAWCTLGMALVCDGRWSEALDAYAKCRELGYADDGSDWIYEALALAKLGRTAEAKAAYERAVASIRELRRDGEENLRRRTAEVAKLLGMTPPE